MRSLLISLLAIVPLPSHAVFWTDDISITSDPSTGTTNFSLLFNRAPDFSTADSIGRQADAFQIWLTDDHTETAVTVVSEGIGASIVRGTELHLGRGVVICSLSPAEDNECEGWGRERGSVDISVSNALVEFSAPTSLLGLVNPEDPPARWFLETYSDHGNIQLVDGVGRQTGLVAFVDPIQVLEPSSLSLVGAGLLAMGWLRRRRSNPHGELRH